MSPLADLHCAYLLADDNSHSLFDRVNGYQGKQTLDKRDILDRGYDTNIPDRPRFSLKDPVFQRLSEVSLSDAGSYGGSRLRPEHR